MQIKARLIDDFAGWQKWGRTEVQPITFFLSLGVVTVLVVAWILTGPVFQLLDGRGDRGRMKIIKNKIK